MVDRGVASQRLPSSYEEATRSFVSGDNSDKKAMSNCCKSCGRQYSGSPDKGYEVCARCLSTQMGRSVFAVAPFTDIDEFTIQQLDSLLNDTQNGPPDGDADGSIDETRWNALRKLVAAARAYNDALKNAR